MGVKMQKIMKSKTLKLLILMLLIVKSVSTLEVKAIERDKERGYTFEGVTKLLKKEERPNIDDLLETTLKNLEEEITEKEKEYKAKKEEEEARKKAELEELAKRTSYMTVTAYCSCAICCGKTNGITASGTRATQGRTIAAPSTYAFGTKLKLEGYGTYVVEDRGGAIKGNKLDLYFNSHAEALAWGRRTIKVTRL